MFCMAWSEWGALLFWRGLSPSCVSSRARGEAASDGTHSTSLVNVHRALLCVGCSPRSIQLCLVGFHHTTHSRNEETEVSHGEGAWPGARS